MLIVASFCLVQYTWSQYLFCTTNKVCYLDKFINIQGLVNNVESGIFRWLTFEMPIPNINYQSHCNWMTIDVQYLSVFFLLWMDHVWEKNQTVKLSAHQKCRVIMKCTNKPVSVYDIQWNKECVISKRSDLFYHNENLKYTYW